MEYIIILGLILLNGLFSMSEIAVISVRRTSLAPQARGGDKGAKAALRLADNPDRFLSTVQVGITLTGIVTGLYSGDVLAAQAAPLFEKLGMAPGAAHTAAQAGIVIAVTYLTIVLGELVPKRIGMTSSEKVAKIMARPMHILSLIAYPFVWLLSKSSELLTKLFGIRDRGNKVTEEEIKSLVREGAEGGEVQEVEQDIVERVFSLGDRDLESIMTLRSDIVWIDTGMDKEQIKDLIERHPFDKYPVADGNLDEIAGIAYIKDMFLRIDSADFDIARVVRPAEYLYENMKVYTALQKMKDGHVQCALISDEFGTVKGMVTLLDIMEALVGDIPEPHDEPEIVERADGSYLVDGQVSFYDFLVYFDMEEQYSKYDYNTLGGLIIRQLGYIPKEGDSISWNGFTLEVVDMDGARIDKVLARRLR